MFLQSINMKRNQNLYSDEGQGVSIKVLPPNGIHILAEFKIIELEYSYPLGKRFLSFHHNPVSIIPRLALSARLLRKLKKKITMTFRFEINVV